MDRRSFLKAAGIASATAVVAPSALMAASEPARAGGLVQFKHWNAAKQIGDRFFVYHADLDMWTEVWARDYAQQFRPTPQHQMSIGPETI